MHPTRSTISKYLACLIEQAGGRLWLSVAVMVVLGLMEGIALLILPAMLQLVGAAALPGLGGVGTGRRISLLRAPCATTLPGSSPSSPPDGGAGVASRNP